MAGNLAHEIKQSKPMSLPTEAALNVQRTAAVLRDMVEEVTADVGGLRHVEYNVLRILRGAGPQGLNTEEIRGRLITDEPVLVGVLGTLANRGLIERGVRQRVISQEGLDVLARLDDRVESAITERASRLSESELRTLVGLLERLRA